MGNELCSQARDDDDQIRYVVDLIARQERIFGARHLHRLLLMVRHVESTGPAFVTIHADGNWTLDVA